MYFAKFCIGLKANIDRPSFCFCFSVSEVEDQQTDRSDYSVCESYICYGAVVQLVCTITGVALPPMVYTLVLTFKDF